MTLAATEALYMDVKIHYLRMLVYGEALPQFELLSADLKNTETLNVDYYIKGLALYLPPMNSFSKQKRVIRRGIKKPRCLKVRPHAANLIDLNTYLASLPGENLTDKICVTE